MSLLFGGKLHEIVMLEMKWDGSLRFNGPFEVEKKTYMTS